MKRWASGWWVVHAIGLMAWPASAAPEIPVSLPSAEAALDGASRVAKYDRFLALFQPFKTNVAALSPDGRYLAYSSRDGTELAVLVVEIDRPEKARAKVIIATDALATPKRPGSITSPEEDREARIGRLLWVTPERLAVETAWDASSVIMAFDIDGENARVLATRRTPEVFRTSASIVAVSLEAPDSLLLRSRRVPVRGRRPEGWVPPVEYDYFRLNTGTGKFTPVAPALATAEHQAAEERREARQREWRAVAAELAAVLPERKIELIDNDDGAARFLAVVRGVTDPGAVYVYDRARGRAWEMARRQPTLDGEAAHASQAFTVTAANGERIAGILTMPRRPLVAPVPVVAIMPEKMDREVSLEFSRPVRALADMGFAVVQFDSHIGREPATGNATADRRLIERLLHVVDGVPGLHPVSARRIALFGEANGAYLALRALQAHPERFRGAVGLEPNFSIEKWRAADLHLSGAARRSPLSKPIQVLVDPGPEAFPWTFAAPAAAREIVRGQLKAGWPASLVELSRDYRVGGPKARAAAYREIERFLVETIYDYEVRIGETKVVEDASN